MKKHDEFSENNMLDQHEINKKNEIVNRKEIVKSCDENISFSNIGEIKKKSLKETAVESHEKTVENISKEMGKYFTSETKKRLKEYDVNEKMNVIPCEEYQQRFHTEENVLGHCDHEGNIFIKYVEKESIKHISTHETMHLCSNRESIEDLDGNNTLYRGLREDSYKEGEEVKTIGRGINEGFTELYTIRELENRGEYEALCSFNSYEQGRLWAQRLESFVGKEKVEKAYFGGQTKELIDEFNRMNYDHPRAWENFCRDIDIVEYSENAVQRELAKGRLVEQYKFMFQNKYGIEVLM